MNSSTFSVAPRAVASLQVPQKDEQLVSAAQAGSNHAFAELRRIYLNRIYRTVFSITRNREDAEDAVQETFLRAYLALKNFERRANFSSWLTRIAINSALMILRKRRSRPELSFTVSLPMEDEAVEHDFKDDSPDPEQSFDHRQQQARLMRSIQRLTPLLREVVMVRMTQECSVKETAELLDISEAAAKSRLYRARVRLSASRYGTGLPRRELAAS